MSSTFFDCFQFFQAVKRQVKAVTLRDLYAPNRIFSRNTTARSHDRCQPCRGFLSRLAEKSLVLGSEVSAACGRRSELSEWQRSTDAKALCRRGQMSGTATGVLRSFEVKIFSHREVQRTKKYFVYWGDDGFPVGKKISSKPYKSLSATA